MTPRWTGFLLALLWVAPVGAQSGLRVQLPDGRSMTFTDTRLNELATDTVRGPGHTSAGDPAYRGVLLTSLLRLAGVNVDTVRGPRATWVVVTTSSDGFRATFSLSELAGYLGPTRAYLAVRLMNGDPIVPAEGPYRVVVPTDQRASRSARQVVRLDVIDALLGSRPN